MISQSCSKRRNSRLFHKTSVSGGFESGYFEGLGFLLVKKSNRPTWFAISASERSGTRSESSVRSRSKTKRPVQ